MEDLATRVRQPGESLSDHAADLVRVAQRAWPDMCSEDHEHFARRAFLSSLPMECQHRVQRIDTTTLSDAVMAAVKVEMLLMANSPVPNSSCKEVRVIKDSMRENAQATQKKQVPELENPVPNSLCGDTQADSPAQNSLCGDTQADSPAQNSLCEDTQVSQEGSFAPDSLNEDVQAVQEDRPTSDSPCEDAQITQEDSHVPNSLCEDAQATQEDSHVSNSLCEDAQATQEDSHAPNSLCEDAQATREDSDVPNSLCEDAQATQGDSPAQNSLREGSQAPERDSPAVTSIRKDAGAPLQGERLVGNSRPTRAPGVGREHVPDKGVTPAGAHRGAPGGPLAGQASVNQRGAARIPLAGGASWSRRQEPRAERWRQEAPQSEEKGDFGVGDFVDISPHCHLLERALQGRTFLVRKVVAPHVYRVERGCGREKLRIILRGDELSPWTARGVDRPSAPAREREQSGASQPQKHGRGASRASRPAANPPEGWEIRPQRPPQARPRRKLVRQRAGRADDAHERDEARYRGA